MSRGGWRAQRLSDSYRDPFSEAVPTNANIAGSFGIAGLEELASSHTPQRSYPLGPAVNRSSEYQHLSPTWTGQASDRRYEFLAAAAGPEFQPNGNRLSAYNRRDSSIHQNQPIGNSAVSAWLGQEELDPSQHLTHFRLPYDALSLTAAQGEASAMLSATGVDSNGNHPCTLSSEDQPTMISFLDDAPTASLSSYGRVPPEQSGAPTTGQWSVQSAATAGGDQIISPSRRLVPSGAKKKRQAKKLTPESQKDERYYEKRLRNNEAARRCRDMKRRQLSELERRWEALKEENKRLQREHSQNSEQLAKETSAYRPNPARQYAAQAPPARSSFSHTASACGAVDIPSPTYPDIPACTSIPSCQW